MEKIIEIFIFLLGLNIFLVTAINAQGKASSDVPIQYEELTAPEFLVAVEKSSQTCIIPFGVLEKHGPHLPLGTDLLDVREIATRAARQEYTIIFPEYYFGQIFEAKHQPGTIAYSHRLIWDLLQETCVELARNGLKKIIIVNGHGGNNNFLKYFCQVQLAQRRDFAVYLFEPTEDPEIKKLMQTNFDYHAGETETATMLVHRPDLVHLDRANLQSGADQKRLQDLPHTYTGIWWYAQFPNHYAGDGGPGNPELGEKIISSRVNQLVQMLQAVKKDQKVRELQQQFFDEAEQPLETRQ